MRVLMVTDFYPPLVGGVEVVVHNLATALSERGHEVSVVTIRTTGLPPIADDGAVRVHRINCSTDRFDRLFKQRRRWAPPVPDPEASLALRRVVALERPEIVHGHDWLARSFVPLRRRNGPSFVMSLHYYTLSCAKKSLMFRGTPCSGPGFGKCLRCGAQHYGAFKGPPVVMGNFVFAAAERRAVDLFLPVSAAAAVGNRLVGSGLPYEIVPNFVPDAPPVAADAAPLLEQLPSGDFLLFVGDVRRNKGVHVLVEAYRGLQRAPPLVLIGKLWGEQRLADLPQNVRVLVDWPNDAVREAQRRCLALVVPSVWPEPFGMVVIEAMAAGRPVIASRIGGLVDLVEDGISGLLVTPDNAIHLREAIERLLGDRELCASLGRSARLRAVAFQPDNVVPRIEDAYARLLAARAHVPRRVRSAQSP